MIQDVANMIKNTSKDSNMGSLKGDKQLKEKLGMTLDTVKEPEGAIAINAEDQNIVVKTDNSTSGDESALST